MKHGWSKVEKLSRSMPIGIDRREVLPKLVYSLSDGDSKYLKKLPRLLRNAQKEVVPHGECLDAVHCYGHTFKLFAEDLREEVPLLDDSIKFILSIRKVFNASKAKISSLKKTCIKLKIKYTQIEEEFDVRYRA